MAITTKNKSLLYSGGANIDAHYGPWSSIDEYTTWITEEVGLDIPDAVTIAVKSDDGTITKYVREKDTWKAEGGSSADVVNTLNSDSTTSVLSAA